MGALDGRGQRTGVRLYGPAFRPVKKGAPTTLSRPNNRTNGGSK